MYVRYNMSKRKNYKDNEFIVSGDCWENLAFGIVRQAVEDYQELLKWKAEKISWKFRVYSRQEIEEFFNSEYFTFLYPNITGREILEKIKQCQSENSLQHYFLFVFSRMVFLINVSICFSDTVSRSLLS